MNHRPLSPDEQQALDGNLLEYRKAKPALQEQMRRTVTDNLDRQLYHLRSNYHRHLVGITGLCRTPFTLFWARVGRAFLLTIQAS